VDPEPVWLEPTGPELAWPELEDLEFIGPEPIELAWPEPLWFDPIDAGEAE
jgi:hypothetical protein